MGRKASPPLSPELQNLDWLLGKALTPFPKTPKDHYSILSLGCGDSKETGILKRSISHFSSTDNPCVSLTGIDIRDREISHANDLFADATTRFIHADASKRNQWPTQENIDLVFLRHQNFWHSRDLWRRIFHNGLSSLKEDGKLVITSYFEEEHRLAVEALENIGAKLVTNIHNHNAIKLSKPGKSVDLRIAVFQKIP